MTFITEKITREELIASFPDKYRVIEECLPFGGRFAAPIRSWITDRNRDTYILMVNCGSGRESDDYLILFMHDDYVILHIETDSYFSWMGGRALAEVVFRSEQIDLKVDEIQAMINDALNGSGSYGAHDRSSPSRADLIISFSKGSK